MFKKTQSMGARVPYSSCSLCGLIDSHTHKFSGNGDRIFMGGREVSFTSLSMVTAPKCPGCAQEMQYSGAGTSWSCGNFRCTRLLVPVETGVGGIVS